MLKSSKVIHAVFKCHDCGVEYQGYKNAQALGAKHAKIKKHYVTGDVGIYSEYDGRE